MKGGECSIGPLSTRPAPPAVNALRRHWRDFVEQFLAPGLPLLLPHVASQRLLRRCARGPLFAEGVEAVTAAALAAGVAAGQADFEWRQRTARLLDMGDALGRARFARPPLDVEGDWPAPGTPFVALSFHFGTGLVGLAHLRRHGTPVAFVSRPHRRADYGAHPLRWWGARARLAGIAAACGAPVVFTGGSYAVLRERLAAGTAVCGLIDTPLPPGRGALAAELHGRRVGLPGGLIRLAREAGVPVVVFSVTPDLDSGRRRLRIEPALPADDAAAVVALAARHLDARLREAPACWYFWHELHALEHALGPDALSS